jgi:hypothetical protein
MKKEGAVSGFQFFCVLFVCRIVSLFTFIISDPSSFPAGDRLIVFLPFAAFGLLAAVPAALTLGPKGDRTLFTLTDSLSPALSRLCAVLYAAGAVWGAAVGLARFGLFTSTVLFPGADVTMLLLLLLAAAVTAARRGTETIARAAVPVCALIAATLVFVFLTTADRFGPENLELPLQNGLLPPVKNGFAAAARTGEAAALLVYAPRVRGRLLKGWAFWLLAVGLTAGAVFLWSLGVMGAYGERQTFQLYALAILSRAGVFERPDALIGAIWVLCAFLRLAFYLHTGAVFLTRGQGDPGVKTLLALAVPAFAAYLALSRSTAALSAALGSGVNEAVFTGLLIGIPTAVYIFHKIKTHGKRAAA